MVRRLYTTGVVALTASVVATASSMPLACSDDDYHVCDSISTERRATVPPKLSAVQLSGSNVDGPKLDGMLTTPLRQTVVPGDATVRDALGYFHANCGHCHNQARAAGAGARCYDPRNAMDLWLQVDRLATPEQTPAYESTVRHAYRRDQIRKRISSRERGEQMPPLGTEEIDDVGSAAIEGWFGRL